MTKQERSYCEKAIINIIINTNLKYLENDVKNNLKIVERVIFPKK